MPLSPYIDDDTTFANNVLCPRYADQDPTSAPPSPASIQSFDILESIPWRRSYISLDSVRQPDYHRRWRKYRAQIIVIILLLVLSTTALTLGISLAIHHSNKQLRSTCILHYGGDRCADPTWARCVIRSGLGYCQGVLWCQTVQHSPSKSFWNPIHCTHYWNDIVNPSPNSASIGGVGPSSPTPSLARITSRQRESGEANCMLGPTLGSRDSRTRARLAMGNGTLRLGWTRVSRRWFGDWKRGRLNEAGTGLIRCGAMRWSYLLGWPWLCGELGRWSKMRLRCGYALFNCWQDEKEAFGSWRVLTGLRRMSLLLTVENPTRDPYLIAYSRFSYLWTSLDVTTTLTPTY